MSSSGFISDIDNTSSLSHQLSDIRQIYTSNEGYTCLFTAVRYGKRFMLKALKPDFLNTPFYQQALRKEFEIGYQLDHPNICRTIGFEHLQDLGDVIILEYIDGVTLSELIRTRQTELLRSLTDSFLPGGELLSALQYMHSKQIVHRDLKPSNIMVTHNGNTVKLIDFSLSDSDAFSILKQSAGTREYMAPEQLLPDAKADVRADIYSLGVIYRQIANITNNTVITALAAKCCQRNPDLRPSSVSAISVDFSLLNRSKNLLLLFFLIILFLLLVAFVLTTLSQKGYL